VGWIARIIFAGDDERCVPEDIPLSAIFLLRAVDLGRLEEADDSAGDASLACGYLKISGEVLAEDDPCAAVRTRGELLDERLAITERELCLELLSGFALPVENNGVAFCLRFDALCRFVAAQVAVEGLGGHDAGGQYQAQGNITKLHAAVSTLHSGVPLPIAKIIFQLYLRRHQYR
jgi:hypothetical protein